MPNTTHCPSCQAFMTAQPLASVTGGKVLIDLCFNCRGIWFDPQENLKLAPSAVLELFKLLHAHRNDPVKALSLKLSCTRCHLPLEQGFDVVRTGRYITYRCAKRHGRFSTFSSFMIEKGFVRLLTRPEIDDMARRVAVISCTSCGAPVDLRTDHACPHCRSALSLLDPQAVERALHKFSNAANVMGVVKASEFADALMMVERDRLQAQREAQAQSGVVVGGTAMLNFDLWDAGISLIGRLMR
jgi:5-methylcytosine-specific restriction endonuclease McrA